MRAVTACALLCMAAAASAAPIKQAAPAAAVVRRAPTTLSGSNDGRAKNLPACHGECDSDAQCAAGLKCFQRENGEAIPGCTGSGGGKNWDYCYDPDTRKPVFEFGGPVGRKQDRTLITIGSSRGTSTKVVTAPVSSRPLVGSAEPELNCPAIAPRYRDDKKGQVMPAGLVVVSIISARGIPKNLFSNPDLYVEFWFGLEGKRDSWFRKRVMYFGGKEVYNMYSKDLSWKAKTPTVSSEGTTAAWDWSCLMDYSASLYHEDREDNREGMMTFSARLMEDNKHSRNDALGVIYEANFRDILGKTANNNGLYTANIALKSDKAKSMDLSVKFQVLTDPWAEGTCSTWHRRAGGV